MSWWVMVSHHESWWVMVSKVLGGRKLPNTFLWALFFKYDWSYGSNHLLCVCKTTRENKAYMSLGYLVFYHRCVCSILRCTNDFEFIKKRSHVVLKNIEIGKVDCHNMFNNVQWSIHLLFNSTSMCVLGSNPKNPKSEICIFEFRVFPGGVPLFNSMGNSQRRPFQSFVLEGSSHQLILRSSESIHRW